jgi:hypothetical protein
VTVSLSFFFIAIHDLSSFDRLALFTTDDEQQTPPLMAPSVNNLEQTIFEFIDELNKRTANRQAYLRRKSQRPNNFKRSTQTNLAISLIIEFNQLSNFKDLSKVIKPSQELLDKHFNGTSPSIFYKTTPNLRQIFRK